MKAKALFLGGISALMLIGCATPNTGNLVIEAGEKPTPQQVEAVVNQYLQENLKDPDSVKQLEIKLLQPMSWYRGLINGGGHENAWLICFSLNAKNSYGGYTGVKTHGIAVRVYGDQAYRVPHVNWAIADNRC